MIKLYFLSIMLSFSIFINAQEQSLEGFRFHNGTTMKGLIWGNQEWTNYFSRIDDYGGNLRIMSDDHIYFTDISTDGKPTNTVMYLNTNTTRLGIGTTDPRYTLDLSTNSAYEGSNVYFGDRRLYLAGFTGTGLQMYGGLVLTNLFNGVRTLDFVIGNNNFDSNKNPENRVMRITNTGKVGIGTDDIGIHRLAVEGSIGAREIKVQATGWSDFVFEKDYDLPTLEEVTSYINQKGHLKDIPSAAEVEKNGVFLGEMDAKLLQKIEELTLYIIEENNKNRLQQDLILKQSALIEKLENRIEELEKKI